MNDYTPIQLATAACLARSLNHEFIYDHQDMWACSDALFGGTWDRWFPWNENDINSPTRDQIVHTFTKLGEAALEKAREAVGEVDNPDAAAITWLSAYAGSYRAKIRLLTYWGVEYKDD